MGALGSDAAGVVFDATGGAWPADPAYLLQRLGLKGENFDVITHSIQKLGFVHVLPIRDALLLRFDPSTVRHLAAFAAFYEIAGRAPKRLILAYLGKTGDTVRYEIFNVPIAGLERVEAMLDGAGKSGSLRKQFESLPADPFFLQAPQGRLPNRRPVAEIEETFGLAVKVQVEDYSKRLSRPLNAIASQDEWFGQLLSIWRDARIGGKLPSSKSFDLLDAVNIACGRAHIVETRTSNPEGYRFRLWGSDNSYKGGRSNITLGETPARLMREITVEDYRQAVVAGVPNYQLIHHIENNELFSYARLLLPLADEGRHVDELVVLFNERRLPELE